MTTSNTPTIERNGSPSDRGVLEEGRPDGVGKPSDDQPVMANVAIPGGAANKLAAHAVEISGMVGETARYGGHGQVHPATGSPIPGKG